MAELEQDLVGFQRRGQESTITVALNVPRGRWRCSSRYSITSLHRRASWWLRTPRK